ncbi:hypothetical protein RHO12_01415 [Orbus sturtevantii]|uniref:YobI family P-loop NTPase n=1 Tax=Orbus sturtevantii TaxID=3074109 RepID=UPI00370DDC62
MIFIYIIEVTFVYFFGEDQYGAGKSSLIESYKKKEHNKKFIHISLANFTPNKEQTTVEENENKPGDFTKIDESVLEGKILNQLIHQIPAKNIPQTNFKVKRKADSRDIFKNTILSIFFIICLFHIFFFEKWREYLFSVFDNGYWYEEILKFFAYKSSLLISFGYCLILFGIFLYHLITAQKNRNIFRRINFQGSEIEIFEESKDSYFDKYLNEVLYLFENTDADVIVFEDLDRFNINSIFGRLREINTLVNNQPEKENSPLRFFYLVRDDIFISKERTKFFDYIIPVVPVVDSSNSYDQFISHFKDSGILDKFDGHFLQGLSLYIDDMRILKNIYNEFLIYYNKLNTTELNYNKMLAIITYKNIFPKDFSDLQLNRGIVCTLFNKKNDLIKQEITHLKSKEIELKEKIELVHNEHAQTIEEIEAIRQHQIKKLNDVYHQKYGYRFAQYSDYRMELSKLDTKIDQRKEILSINLSEVEVELANTQKEIRRVQSKNLYEILTKENIDEVFKTTKYTNEIDEVTTFNEIKGSEYFDLLKYLIRNGYIDETYSDYMTYFYGNSLTQADKIFLRSITDKKAKDYTYQLKNIPLIISRLRHLDFEQEEILNFDLFQFLLTEVEYKFQLNLFFEYLKSNQDFKFIWGYFETSQKLTTYITKLNLYWPEIFDCILSKQALSINQIKKYSLYTLYCSNNLKAINTKQCLSNYISNDADYLNVEKPIIETLIDSFNELNIRFVKINYDAANKQLFEKVYQNHLYEINADNLILMLQKIYQCNNLEDINHKNYTLIISQPESPLASCVNDNIEMYINIIFSICEGEIRDDENAVVLLLNNGDLPQEDKNNYIDLLQTRIESINSIENTELIDLVVDLQKAVCTEANIVVYFKQCNNTLNNPLIRFINNGTQKLDFSEYDEDIKGILFRQIITCDYLSDNKYKEILSTLNRIYNDEYPFPYENIKDEKFKILVDLKVIRMGLGSLKFLREHYDESLLFYYIKNNIETYKQITNNENYNLDEIIEILNWDIGDDIKLELLDFVHEPISILEKGYSATINKYILDNNFNDEDLIGLVTSYEKWGTTVQSKLLEKIIQSIDRLMLEPENISITLLKDLISLDTLDIDLKINLLISKLSELNKDECSDCLSIMKLSEYDKLFDLRKKNKITISKSNEKLLIALKDNGDITDYTCELESDYYTIIKPKKANKANKDEELLD